MPISPRFFGARFTEFFEEESDRLSMSRLILYGCFGSLIMLLLTLRDHMTEGYFDFYVSAFALTYLGGKTISSVTQVRQAKAMAAEPKPAEEKPPE
jgi:hypothetical protein